MDVIWNGLNSTSEPYPTCAAPNGTTEYVYRIPTVKTICFSAIHVGKYSSPMGHLGFAIEVLMLKAPFESLKFVKCVRLEFSRDYSGQISSRPKTRPIYPPNGGLIREIPGYFREI